MVRIKMKPPLSPNSLNSAGIKPYKDWDEEEVQATNKQSKLIEITPNDDGTIPRPYYVE